MTELFVNDLIQESDSSDELLLDFYQMFVDWQQRELLFELQQEINSL